MGEHNVNENRITTEGIRNLLNPIKRRRHIVFCAAEDREKIAEVCRTLRGEGYEIVEKVHRWLVPGSAYCVDADFLQTFQKRKVNG